MKKKKKKNSLYRTNTYYFNIISFLLSTPNSIMNIDPINSMAHSKNFRSNFS